MLLERSQIRQQGEIQSRCHLLAHSPQWYVYMLIPSLSILPTLLTNSLLKPALKTLLRNHRTINQATQHYHLRVEARINTWKAYLIELSTCKEKDRFNRFGPFELTDVYLYAKIIHGYMVNEAKRILKESGGSEEVLKKASFAGFEIGRDLTAAYQVLYA